MIKLTMVVAILCLSGASYCGQDAASSLKPGSFEKIDGEQNDTGKGDASWCDSGSYLILNSGTKLCGEVGMQSQLFSRPYFTVNGSKTVKLSEVKMVRMWSRSFARVTSMWGGLYLAEQYKTGSFDVYRLKVVNKLEGLLQIASKYNYYIVDSSMVMYDANYTNAKIFFGDNEVSMKYVRQYRNYKIAKWSCWAGGLGMFIAGIPLTEGKPNISPFVFIGFGVYWLGYVFHFVEPQCMNSAITPYFAGTDQ
jgi:hypothetical protein